MKKLLRASDKILLSLAFLGDFAIEAYARGHGFGWKKRWSEALCLKNSTFRLQMHRFLRTGEIEKKVNQNGEVYFALSAPGWAKVERLYPLSKLKNKSWDRKWRVVIFDIEEKEKITRNSLRRKLISLGFGKIQKSVYVSPLDVLSDLKEFLDNVGLYGEVVVFEAKEILGFGSKTLAQEVWQLDKLNKAYEELIGEIENQTSPVEKNKIKEKFFQLLLKDPMLPEELLPENWFGNKVKKIIIYL